MGYKGAYKATREWEVKPITKIANLIKNWTPAQEKWDEGAVVYIYKNKGGAGECKNYMPICITHITYKKWYGHITRKLTKIMHILTGNGQFGFKDGILTSGAKNKIGIDT